MPKLHHIFLVLLFPLAVHGELAPEVEESFEVLSLVTGFHSFIDKSAPLEFRILEADGSATVALNPVYLFLVVTNNLPGPEDRTTVVRLPQVSQFVAASADMKAGKLVIRAKFDGASEMGAIVPLAREGEIAVVVKQLDSGKYQVSYETTLHGYQGARSDANYAALRLRHTAWSIAIKE